MIDHKFGKDDAFEMQNEYTLIYTTNKAFFSEDNMYLPDELIDTFFETDGRREKRIIFMFDGREYPTYLEADKPGGNYKLIWSVALINKFYAMFPDYENFFDNLDEYSAPSTPKLYIEKMEESLFMLKLIFPEDEGLILKQAFFDYIGPGKSIANFKDSYELVFLKYYLENADNRWRSNVFMVAAQVQKFYVARLNEGKEQDPNADTVIENIMTAGLDDILSFLMEHPYMAFADKNFLMMETVDEHFYFTLDTSILYELGTDDKRFLLDLTNDKIDYYFERFDGPGLQENLNTLIDGYADYFTRDFRYSFKDVLIESIPASISGYRFISANRYKIVGYAGDDEWALVPHVSIMDKAITRIPGEGVSIQYLLNKDKRNLYLALTIGFKKEELQARKNGVENEATVLIALEDALQPKIDEIRSIVNEGSFSSDIDKVELPDQRYLKSIIYFKEYQGSAPADDILQEDLKAMLDVYDKYYQHCILKIPVEIEEDEEIPDEADIDEEYEEDEDLEEADESEDDSDDEIEEEIEEDDTDEDSAEEDVENSDDQVDASDETQDQIEVSPEPETEELVSEEKPEALPEEIKPKKKKKSKKASKAETTAAAVQTVAMPAVSEATLKAIQKLLEDNQKPVIPELVKRNREERREETLDDLPTDVSGVLHIMRNYIVSGGFACEDELVSNFYLSLRSKPFVLLTGRSGVGKSQFVRLFAEAMGANVDNGRYKQVPVRAEWQDSKGLLGYLDNGHFIPGAIIDFIADACDNPDYPFFLCLDEMGSAKIENYFSEMLSVMETRRKRNDTIVTDPIIGDEIFGRDEAARKYYGDVYLPSNLMIVGTITANDARNDVSIKVLDRANLIEIIQGPLVLPDVIVPVPQAMNLSSGFLQNDLLVLAQCTHHREMIQEVITLLDAINGILADADAQFGYKVRDEVGFYLLANAQYNLMNQEAALDYAIVQNILPRIIGGSTAVEEVMISLFKICAGTQAEGAIRNYPGGGLFPKSAEKLSYMMKRYDHDGKVSFWK